MNNVKPIKPASVKSNRVKPLSPKEVDDAKIIPDEVMAAFNTLIAKEWDGASALIRQNEVIKEVMKNVKESGANITRDMLFDEHYLDVEPTFRKSGWSVEYDKPAYCETYEPNWTFKKRKKDDSFDFDMGS